MEWDDERSATAGPTAFDRALADLKRRGSALLVVGTVPHEAYVRASRRMLGDADADPPRRRIVALPDADPQTAADRLAGTGPVDASHARVITCSNVARGTSTAASTSGSPAGNGHDPGLATAPRVRTVDATILEIGAAVEEVIAQFDGESGGLDPAELRLGFDCLATLLAEYDREQVFGFLHVLTARVRSVRGMGHFRLMRPRDDELVRTVAPLFDAVVELRMAGRRLEQRWYLRDEGIASEWFPVADADPTELDD